MLALRLFAAYEFLESGLEKWNGENWFADINSQFPFPFNLLSDTVNWNLAMWAELVLPALLIVGLATRLSALGLMVVTAVAWSAVHAGLGYNVCDNGYKMALIYLVVLFLSYCRAQAVCLGCTAEETLLPHQVFSLRIIFKD